MMSQNYNLCFADFYNKMVFSFVQGSAPSPRGCHASALLGNKGYISGGVVSSLFWAA